MAKRGKKYAKASELIDKDTEYTLDQACKLVKQAKIASFDESVDLDIRLGVDPRHADQMVRGTVSLPHGTGRSVRVLALVNEAKQAEATEAGADHVGLDDYIAKIEEGWAEIDVIVATPDVMGKLGKLGRVLGPRGLMPNPKSGTVTMDVKDAVESFKSGKIDFRVDKAGILHTSIGKTSFNEDALRENAAMLISTIIKMKPSSSKGTYIKSAFMSSTMGPSIPLSRSTISSL
ncbi:MAG TPA: 50S ribosomal protein L1 [Bacteroidetes bacterium]|jgi:large subunit ribosomal protein L1|nr:MAG: 50S ribosomal protein L1 [Rhodothermaeota bacterium MED-G64]RPF80537.1 MAG: 50S ribosomal protein L1 [Rhodothermaceae bacterium TMED105]HBD42664.1 50S ribosomal protein L1 [Bacteroidota bacterium]HBW00177.1 50S ribosomal protein L1 [Bacteroidota bacterium]|tara:strand:- start:5125 stop:5823 length:699 start_codon:yes stop_codon:yes gene_type:complete